jgi:hypothetical protein
MVQLPLQAELIEKEEDECFNRAASSAKCRAMSKRPGN